MTKMPELHVRSMKINRNSLVVILISVVITLFLYIFFFNLVAKDANKKWEDNNITSVVNKIPKFTSNELQVGDLFEVGTKEKVDINKFEQEIRDYYFKQLNFSAFNLSDDINVGNAKKESRGYQWWNIFQKDNENYVVMFYNPSNMIQTYNLYEYKLPSLNSTIEFRADSDWNLISIKDAAIEINISAFSNGEEVVSFKANKLVQIEKPTSEFNIYRYETRLEDGTYQYIYGDNSLISFQKPCGDLKAPCGFLGLPYFSVACNVKDRSSVSICDEFVNSIKEDRRSWEVMTEAQKNIVNNKFVPFQ